MIKVLNIDKFLREHKAKGPVITNQIYFGRSKNFHPEGIYSEEIFGAVGSLDRKKNFSWINLNCPVIHPVFYNSMKLRIERKIVDLLSGEKTYRINEDGILIEDEEGTITGMSKFYENIKNIKFRKNDNPNPGELDTLRNQIIDVMEKNIKENKFFINKLVVIPPDFRPIVDLVALREVRVDELSVLYQKILVLSSHLKGVSGVLFDILSYRMQLLMVDLYNLVRERISKKTGIIRDSLLGRRVDFSARAVVSPNPNLNIGEIGVPLRLVCQIFEPNMIYALMNSPFSKRIPEEFYSEIKNFLKKESALGIEV